MPNQYTSVEERFAAAADVGLVQGDGVGLPVAADLGDGDVETNHEVSVSIVVGWLEGVIRSVHVELEDSSRGFTIRRETLDASVEGDAVAGEVIRVEEREVYRTVASGAATCPVGFFRNEGAVIEVEEPAAGTLFADGVRVATIRVVTGRGDGLV